LFILHDCAIVGRERRFRAPSVHEAIAALKQPGGAPAITRFTTSVVVATVLPFALGIAFLVLGLMGRAPSWFGR
jgi:hypothetical protein